MAAFATAYTTGSVWLGFVAAMIASLLVALRVAYASISLRLNQVAARTWWCTPALPSFWPRTGSCSGRGAGWNCSPPSALGTHFEQERSLLRAVALIPVG